MIEVGGMENNVVKRRGRERGSVGPTNKVV